jgi:WD40 repeat protein
MRYVLTHLLLALVVGGEFREQRTTQQKLPILSSAVNNPPGFIQPLVVVATEDKLFSVVQNSTVEGNYLITASMDGNLRLYDSRDGSLIRNFVGHQASVNGALLTSDDAFVISCSGNYDARWQSQKSLNGEGTDNSIRIWDLPSGLQILRLPLQGSPVCHYLGVSAITANEAGTIVVSGGFDNAVCVWDRTTGKLLSKFGGLSERTTENGTVYVDSNAFHAGPITAVGSYTEPSDTGFDLLHRAVSCSDDASFRIWDIGVDSTSAFTEVECIGPASARCRQPNPFAHTQAITCMTILKLQPAKQVLVTGNT